MPYRGLFVGLTTLDCIYRVDAIPRPNQKIVATASTIAAGGPATNAAVAFRYLGNEPVVLSVVGQHPIHYLIKNDLDQYGVAIADLIPTYPDSPPVSSIFVTAATGDRAVVSVNATKCQATVDQIPDALLHANGLAGSPFDGFNLDGLNLDGLNLDGIDVVLIDGHQMAVGAAIAQAARDQGIPVVVDGGSWKPGFESVLQHTDIVVCSANFYPPGCATPEDVMQSLATLGIPHIALTQGDRPIRYKAGTETGALPVPSVQAVDTLGAGDMFHGAFCHFLMTVMGEETLRPSQIGEPHLITALTQSATLAAQSCQFFGTREWMRDSLKDSRTGYN